MRNDAQRVARNPGNRSDRFMRFVFQIFASVCTCLRIGGGMHGSFIHSLSIEIHRLSSIEPGLIMVGFVLSCCVTLLHVVS